MRFFPVCCVLKYVLFSSLRAAASPPEDSPPDEGGGRGAIATSPHSRKSGRCAQERASVPFFGNAALAAPINPSSFCFMMCSCVVNGALLSCTELQNKIGWW